MPARSRRAQPTTSRSVTEAALRDFEALKLQAETERHKQEARRARLIADEIEHEQERKRASSDEARVFPFYTSVQGNSVRAAMEMLGEWSRLHKPGSQAFTVEITSPGGSVFDGLALFDYVKELRHKGYTVNTYGTGLVASMATVLLQMGDTRILGANSWFMVHELSDFIVGNLSEIEDGAKIARKINDNLSNILLERATVSKRTFKTKSERKDWYMTAQEAVALGFADELR